MTIQSLVIRTWGGASICLCLGLPAAAEEPAPSSIPRLPAPEGAAPLSPKYDVWLDVKRGVVLVDGQISLRRGMLEMFACLRNTKEHESIVSANTQAFLVHAALLRLGAEPGHPAQFVPEFKPPAGTEIEIQVQWRDPSGKLQSTRAQEWIRDVQTGKSMVHPWVNRQEVLSGRRRRLYLRFQLRHRGDRYSGREFAIERSA
jgi:hypothetical protein